MIGGCDFYAVPVGWICDIIKVMKLRGRKGQTLVEYVLVFSALLAVVGSLTYLLGATRRAVVRTESLVGSDYP